MNSLPATPLSVPLSRIARLSRVMEITTDIGIALVAGLMVAGFVKIGRAHV